MNASRRIVPARSRSTISATRPASCGPRNVSAPADGFDGPRAERQHERVVGDPRAVLRLDRALAGQHACDRVAVQPHAAVGGDRRERQAAHAAAPERLGHGERAVGEVAAGREQLDLEPVAGELLKGEHGLEAGHSAAGDEHTQWE